MCCALRLPAERIDMTKVVIAEWGVFQPSEACIRAYAVRKGFPIYDAIVRWMAPRYWTVAPEQRPAEPTSAFEKRHLFDPNEIRRDDPDLIAVIEELGETCDTKDCTLKIVEIPDDVRWYIDAETRGGGEQVAEQHRTWW
jgi:hypothetical protein